MLGKLSLFPLPPPMPRGLPPANKLPPKKRTQAKSLYERGLALTAIADQLSISRRTVSDWAKSGGWTRPADRAAAAGGSGPAGGDGGDQRAVIDPDTIDVDLILAATIMDLRAAMVATQKNYDYRPLSNLAMAIFKALDTWAARHPVTPAALAKMAIEMNTSPYEFQDELLKQWNLHHGGKNSKPEA